MGLLVISLMRELDSEGLRNVTIDTLHVLERPRISTGLCAYCLLLSSAVDTELMVMR